MFAVFSAGETHRRRMTPYARSGCQNSGSQWAKSDRLPVQELTGFFRPAYASSRARRSVPRGQNPLAGYRTSHRSSRHRRGRNGERRRLGENAPIPRCSWLRSSTQAKIAIPCRPRSPRRRSDRKFSRKMSLSLYFEHIHPLVLKTSSRWLLLRIHRLYRGWSRTWNPGLATSRGRGLKARQGWGRAGMDFPASGATENLATPEQWRACFPGFHNVVLVANSDEVSVKDSRRNPWDGPLRVLQQGLQNPREQFSGNSLLISRAQPRGANIVIRTRSPTFVKLLAPQKVPGHP